MARDRTALDAELAGVVQELAAIGSAATEERLRIRIGGVVDRLQQLRFAAAAPRAGDARKHLRMGLAAVARLEVGGVDCLCAIRDISRGGALVDSEKDLNLGDAVVLNVPEAGPIEATVVAMSPAGVHIGFHALTSAQEVAIIEMLKNRYAA